MASGHHVSLNVQNPSPSTSNPSVGSGDHYSRESGNAEDSSYASHAPDSDRENPSSNYYSAESGGHYSRESETTASENHVSLSVQNASSSNPSDRSGGHYSRESETTASENHVSLSVENASSSNPSDGSGGHYSRESETMALNSLISLSVQNASSSNPSDESRNHYSRESGNSDGENPSSDYYSAEDANRIGNGTSSNKERIQYWLEAAGVQDSEESEESFMISPEEASRINADHTRTDWISESRFLIVLKSSSDLKTDEYTKVDKFQNSTIDSDYFDKALCHYTIPVDGTYRFVVVKQGHAFYFRLLNSNGKKAQAVSRGNRASVKLVVKWRCCQGQKVWVEDIGDQSGSTITISGILLPSQ